MQPPVIPVYEQKRLQALHDLDILDTQEEERFERLTRMVQKFCKVPIVLISLIDANRQWFKSKQGLAACETSREISFCGHAILQRDIFYIPNALLDPRFADNPLVTGPPHVIAYAGVPLILANGYCVGTLCLIDHQPRTFTEEQFQFMRDVAAIVKQELELKKIFSEAEAFHQVESRLHAVFDNIVDSIVTVDSHGIIEGVNPATEQLFGYQRADLLGLPISQLVLTSPSLEHILPELAISKKTNDQVHTINAIREDGSVFPAELTISPMQIGSNTLFTCLIHNVSAFKTIEKALKEANRQNQSIVDNANYSIITCDNAGMIQSFNKASQNMLGYRADEIIGKATPAIYLDSDEMKARTDKLKLPVSSDLDGFIGRARMGESDEFECTYVRKDGSRIPVMLTVNALRDDDGDITGFLGIANDISHEKAAKAAAQESEARFRDLFDSASDLILSMTPDGRFQYVNRAWLETLKYQAVDITQLSLSDVTPASKYMCWQDLITRVLKGEVIDCIEVTFLAEDQSLVIAEGSINSQWANGKVIAIRGIFRDITQRKQHEQHILEQKIQLETALIQNQSILDNANCSIISTDTNGMILSFNKGAEVMLGYKAEEVINQTTPIIFHDTDEVIARAKTLSLELNRPIKPNLDVFFTKTIMGQIEEAEWMYRHKDGHLIPVQLTITAQKDPQGNIVGFLGIAIDITERKRIERMKSEFVSTVSHELRTPLTSIRGALGLVMGKASAGMSEKAKILIETASRNSERLTLLINDILDLEKIESGNLAFNMKPADLTEIASQAINSNEGYALQHNVRLAITATLDRASIMGDEHRLLQVFSNLLSNAVKYSHPQSVVELSIIQVGNHFKVGIKDHGLGIPPAFREQLFQRFAQADSSDTRAKGGTGLGLSITKAIIERHGGHISYNTEEGVGTEFYFELPEWLEVRTEVSDNKPKILICEDNADAASVLSQILNQEGIVCDIVGTGRAALKLLDTKAYRALLLDLTLPDMDGLTLISQLRADERLYDLPIIVVSGRAEEGQYAFLGDAIKVVDWIQKPVEHDRLLRALHQVLLQGHKPSILHVEDDADIIAITRELVLNIADYHSVTTLAQAREALANAQFDMVMIDISLPDGSGLDLLDLINKNTQVLILSGCEPHRDIAEKVTAVLLKSKTSNSSLLTVIKEIIGL